MEVRVKSLLGVAPIVSGGASYLDETELQFIAGRSICSYDSETRATRFTQCSPNAVAITALALSGNRKLFAFAEYGVDGTPSLHIHDAASRKRKRSIAGLSHGRAPITHVGFVGGDAKHLLIQTGAPDWNLHYVLWDKAPGGRVLSVFHNAAPPRSGVVAVDADPGDPSIIAVSGPGFLRMLRVVDGAFKPMSLSNMRKEPSDVSCHAWLEGGRLLLGHACGELWLVEGPEFRRVLDRTPRKDAGVVPSSIAVSSGSGATTTAAAASWISSGSVDQGAADRGSSSSTSSGSAAPDSRRVSSSSFAPSPLPHAVRCVTAFSKGFVAGCDGGLIQVYERTEDAKAGVSYQCVAEFRCKVPEEEPLTSASSSAAGAVSTTTGVAASSSASSSAIARIAVNSSEEEAAVITASGQVYGFKLGSYDLHSGEAPFRSLLAPMHELTSSSRSSDGTSSAAAGGGGIDATAAAPAAAGHGKQGLSSSSSTGGSASPAPGHGRRTSLFGTTASNSSSTNDAGPLPRAHTAADEALAITQRVPVGRHYDPLYIQPSGGPPVITALASCARKPWFVTAGSDRSVRIWSFLGPPNSSGGYEQQPSSAGGRGGGGGGPSASASAAVPEVVPHLVMAQRLDEPLTAMALHPSGHHAVFATDTSACLVNIMLDSFKVVKEFHVRSCTDVSFSHGGQYFAVANGATINVYGSYTCALVVTLRGHTDKVQCLAWSRDDRCIVSAGKDGNVIRWAIVVPNATISGNFDGPTGVTSVVGGGAGGSSAGGTRMSIGGGGAPSPYVGLGGSRGSMGVSSRGLLPSTPGGSNADVRPQALVGKVLHSVEMRDFHPTALAMGSTDSGKDVFVAGVITRGGQTTSVLRHIEVTSSSPLLRDALPKADVPMAGQVVRSLLHLTSLKLLVAGMGHAVEKARQGPQLLTSGGPKLTEAGYARSVGGGDRDRDRGDDAATVASSRHGGGGGGLGGITPTSAAGHSMAQRSFSRGASVNSGAVTERDRGMDGDLTSTYGGGGRGRRYGRSDSLGDRGSAGGGSHSPTEREKPQVDCAGAIRLYSTSALTASDPAGPASVHMHSAPVIRMTSAYGGRLLISASADGTLALHHVSPDPKAVASTASPGAIAATASSSAPSPSHSGNGSGGGTVTPAASSSATADSSWAEETLVSRGELEAVAAERRRLTSELAERSAGVEASLRAMDAEQEARVRDITSRYASALAEERGRMDELRQSKGQMEDRAEEQLIALGERHRKALLDLEATYRGRLQTELHRFDALVGERDVANSVAQAGLKELAAAHGAELREIKERYAAAMREEEALSVELESQLRGYRADAERSADDIEADADKEMADMRHRYDARLATEAKASLLLRGENGFMKRRFLTINKEITDLKDDISGLADKERGLQETIASLQKDVAGHKKEIAEREETMSDKEARIYDLKKKNQELEKFKFVLNYKIQELRRQIMPRKREMQDLRDHMKEMELELLQYHKSNAALDLMISDLKLRRDGMRQEVRHINSRIKGVVGEQTKIARDVTAIHSVADVPPSLRASMVRLFNKYVHGEAGSLTQAVQQLGGTASLASAASDSGGEEGELSARLPVGVDVEDVQREMARQRNYLERNVDSLRRKIAKDLTSATQDDARLARENAALMEELDVLTRDLVYMQGEVQRLREADAAAAAAAPCDKR